MTTPADPAPEPPAPPAYGVPGPAPARACGYVKDGINRCGATPVVARLTAAYTAGEQTLLCADDAARFPDTVEWDGQVITTKERV